MEKYLRSGETLIRSLDLVLRKNEYEVNALNIHIQGEIFYECHFLNSFLYNILIGVALSYNYFS